jgi:hypothetical protein
VQALILALVLVGCRAPHDAAEPDDDAPLDGSRNDIGLFGGPYGDWSPP